MTKVTLRLELDRDIALRADALLTKRGTSIATFLRLKLQELLLESPLTVYELDTQVQFGKYRGERLENIIRVDPGYVLYLRRTSKGFPLSEEALELLETFS